MDDWELTENRSKKNSKPTLDVTHSLQNNKPVSRNSSVIKHTEQYNEENGIQWQDWNLGTDTMGPLLTSNNQQAHPAPFAKAQVIKPPSPSTAKLQDPPHKLQPKNKVMPLSSPTAQQLTTSRFLIPESPSSSTQNLDIAAGALGWLNIKTRKKERLNKNMQRFKNAVRGIIASRE